MCAVRGALAVALVAGCAPALPTGPAATGPAATAPVAAGPATGSVATAGTVRGLLTDVQAASLTMLREVELRTDDGRTLRFAVEGDTGITPGHARDHMVNADPVTITYRSERGSLVALRIDD